MKRLITSAILAGLPAVASAQATNPEGSQLSVMLVGKGGTPAGIVEMKDTPHGVLIVATFEEGVIPAGVHAMHFHEKGDCSDIEKFESAGGHYNPGKSEHGYFPANGPHAGDMPNIVIGSAEKSALSAFNHMVRFKEGDAPLLDADGSALVIHASGDDYESQPSGNSGDRIACAEIK